MVLGLLQDDNEWNQVLEDADNVQLCPAQRELYITIVLYCEPANPRKLFDDHWQKWTDDINMKARQRGVILEEGQVRTMVLLDLQRRLQSREKDLRDAQLPEPTPEELSQVEVLIGAMPVVIREELDFNVQELRSVADERRARFTEAQATVFNTILTAVVEEQPLQLFIDARGGCGKTYVLNAVLTAVRGLEPGGCVALATGTTGIAANLLRLGRTFHSRLKAPLTPTEESTFAIKGQTALAKLIRMAKLLLIDESTMLHRYQLEALDRTLRDLMRKDQPFGGKVVVLAGDFRQWLPVVPRASRAGTVDTCINRSPLWSHFKVLELTVNMRVRASGDKRLEDFDRWLLSLGDGTVQETGDSRLIEIPPELCSVIGKNTKEAPEVEGKSMVDFCEKIFPNLAQNISDTDWLEGRAILAPTNSQVDTINDLLVEKLPGDSITLHSSDALDNPRDAFRYNTEYLNTLNPTGLPRSKLCLKPGMPVMLLRNLNPTEGLCNGTKLVFKEIRSNRLLVCKTIGEETERTVYIPRISLRPKEKQYPFEWSRRQFPIRSAFSTTINKAQGQTLKSVGVWLPQSVFGHGQLYVAASRVGAPDRIHFAIRPEDPRLPNFTKNIVYREVLLHHMEQGQDEGEPARQQEVGEEIDIGNWAPTDEYEGPYDEVDEGDDDDK